MQTRTITEVLVYKLVLNNMRSNTESRTIVAVSTERQNLIDWYNDQLAPEPYYSEGSPSFDCHGNSHTWYKVFKEGSELEWYNPCYSDFEPDHCGHGISSVWINESELYNHSYRIV